MDKIEIRVNAPVIEGQLSDLAGLIGWTSIVSDNVRHAFLLDVMVYEKCGFAMCAGGWMDCAKKPCES